MYKLISFFVLTLLIADAISQQPYIILPTYRPPPHRPVTIRTVRSAEQGEPQWLYKGDVPRAPASGDHPQLPTYIDDIKLDPNRRYARRAEDQEPLWLYQDYLPRAPASGDHPVLPNYTDDINIDPNTRYARSLDSPSAKRGGGSHSTSSGSRDTGATHPGYNRRNA